MRKLLIVILVVDESASAGAILMAFGSVFLLAAVLGTIVSAWNSIDWQNVFSPRNIQSFFQGMTAPSTLIIFVFAVAINMVTRRRLRIQKLYPDSDLVRVRYGFWETFLLMLVGASGAFLLFVVDTSQMDTNLVILMMMAPGLIVFLILAWGKKIPRQIEGDKTFYPTDDRHD